MIDANSPKQLGAFKFKPFLLVCVEGAQPEQDNYLECLTQNEAEKFLLKLAELPEFSDSKLLRALERALRFEVHDSAALLFDWYKGGEPGRGESILLGMPRGRTWKHRMLNSFFRMLWSVPGINMLPVRRKVRGTLFNVLRKIPGGGTIAFYAGYPVFTLAYHAISLSADQKLQALIETLDAMDVAPGNDNLRHAVIESMSLALGRILGAEGRFADAGVYVERGLRVQPHSIHLNKVRHALSFRRRDAFVSMAASGFQSFALVCIERETAGTSKYLQCRTPGDVPAFILELTELPEYAKSKLIRALERALANEIHESAELLFSWVHENDSQTAEYISTGLPSFDCPMSFYSGYPVFTVALGGVSASPALKQQSLAGTLDAYEAARGIGEVRSSLIEAFTFALVRSLGNLGRYAEAASHVDRGLRYRPYSIYLKAARHALTLRIEGKNPPKRFDKFIGEDTGYLKQFVCPEPFKRFDIGPDGNVLVCCGHWLPTSIGNFINDPIDDVLNSEKAQHLRRSVTDGSYQYCNHLECASMIHDRLVPRTETADADIEHAIEFQDFRVKRVEQVLFALDQSCNLSCPSCRREQIMEKASDSAEKAEAVELKLQIGRASCRERVLASV